MDIGFRKINHAMLSTIRFFNTLNGTFLTNSMSAIGALSPVLKPFL